MNKKTNYKVLSHVERMANPQKEKLARVKKAEVYEVYVKENVVKNGKIYKEMTVKTFDPKDENKHRKVNDYCIENLEACGALGSLNTVSLSGSQTSMIDTATLALSKLDNINISEE